MDDPTAVQLPTPPVPIPPAVVPPKFKEQGGATTAIEPATTPIAEPIVEDADKIAKEEGDEYWENYAREIELEKEIAEIGGMEKVESGEVKLPEDVAKQMGIKPTVTIDTPIAKTTDFSVRGTALSDEQLGIGLAKPTSSGLRWLVEWFIYQLLKAHFFVKKVKGKVLRRVPETPATPPVLPAQT